MKKILLPVLAFLFLIPACGGGDSDDGLEALAKAIEESIDGDEESGLAGKGACVAEKAIAYGADELEKNGITLEVVNDPEFNPEDLPQGGQDIVLETSLDCLSPADIAAIMVQGAAEEGDDLPMEAALCYAENMTREEWRLIVNDGESDEALNIFLRLSVQCPEVLVQMFMDDMQIDRSSAECAVAGLSEEILLSLTSTGEGEPDMETLVELFEVFVACGIDPEMMG